MSVVRPLVLVTSGLVLLGACTSGPAEGDVADTVYTNGRIYTVNEAQPWAEAVAIKDGRFMVVGSVADASAVVGERTEVIDLEGQFALPGIQENHVHASLAGATIEKAANRVLFTPKTRPDEILEILTDYMAQNPGDGWVRGGQWGAEHFENGQPHKSLLDRVAPDRPVVFIDETVHHAWVNSRALEIAGITADTPQPGSGVIGKDPRTGEPTGFLADGGMTEVLKHVPQPSVSQWEEAILASQEVLLAYGVTAITDAAAGNRASLDAYKALDEKGALKMRVDYVVMMNDYMADVPDPWEVINGRAAYRSRLLKAEKAKIGVDGVPLSGASLLLEPYTNDPSTRGKTTASEKDFTALIDAAGEGMQMMAHAVGDGSIRRALDTIEQARERHPDNQRLAQIAHPIWPSPEDIPRFKTLKVVAEVSPPLYFWTPLMKAHLPVLGEERVSRAMPIREFLDAGVVVSYGSDWPAGTPSANPWRALEGMVTRQNPDGEFPGEALGQPVSLEEALTILTLNGAIAMEHEEQTGTIEVGKYADMILLDSNPFDLFEAGRADKIGDMKVTRTLFEGEVVFDRTATIEALDVVDIEITNEELDNAVDAAELDIIIQKDLAMGAKGQCFPGSDHSIGPGSPNAPEVVNRAFAALESRGFQFARHAREIGWKKGNEKYWIQWTLKDDIAVLWAFDPEASEAIEVLRVREK